MASIKSAILVIVYIVSCLAQEDQTPRGPHIVREPQDTIFDKDSDLTSVSLECEADGYPRPSYKWFKDGSEIDILGDTRLTLMEGRLTIGNPRDGLDSGAYRCQAENTFGIVISREADLLFGYVDPFSTRTQPPKTATENSGFMLECQPPDAFPDLTFFWYKNVESNFVRESGRVMVASNGNLYFAKVEQQDSGDYYCVVKSSLDPAGTGAGQDLRVSKPVQVSVLSSTFTGYKAPRVSHAVQDQTVLEGDDVKLECFFEGSPVPRLSWQRVAPKSKAIPRSATYDNQNQILILRNIQLEDAGNYQCTASNYPEDNPDAQEQTSSSTGTIDVRAPPQWVKQLEDVEADIQTNAVFECEAEGTAPISYKWYRNGEQLTTRSRHSFSNNFKRLSIINLEEDDSAMYQCQASNTLLNKERAIYSTGQLTVLALAPSFDKNPMVQNQPAAKNGNVTIVCNPEAAPKPEFTWFHDDKEVTTGGRYTILENGNLFIDGVLSRDGGKYKCVVKNYLGEDEDEGQLIIRDGTVFTKWPLSKTLEVGESVTLDCRATSDPLLDLTYIWLLDGMQIDLDEDHHYKRLKDGNLEIVNAKLRQGGVYTCLAMTTVDEVSRSANVIVEGPPGPPAGVIASDVTANSCQLRWSKGSENNSPIKSYTIESRTNYEPEWVVERANIPPSDGLSVSLNSLSPWSDYEFRVIATNDIGSGKPSHPSDIYETEQDKPYMAPKNVGGGGGQTGDLRITWDPLPRQEQNAAGVGYSVYWKRAGTAGDFSKETVYVQDDGVYTVKGVPTYVQYQVRVGAFNSLGDGPNSTIVTVYSHEAAPTDYPRDVSAEAKSGSEIKVTWSRISTTNLKGRLRGYKIKYWSSEESEATAFVSTSPGIATNHIVDGLEPSTLYHVKVLAYSGGGNGPPSQGDVKVTTMKSAPLQAPYNVKASVRSLDSVAVTWSTISTGRYEEPLLGYKILYYLDGRFERDASKVTVKGATTTKGIVSGLQAGRAYLLQVQGYSEGGDGATSEPIKISLYGSAPLIGGIPSMHCVSVSLLVVCCLLHIVKYLW
ncbi:contactin-5-like isoform X2 [Ptychodera flava]|uniref:contactin-5-like isoform X2 n=1 Tax=Ptychodera flava TaxID=63121 RepID=UPI00396AAFBE